MMGMNVSRIGGNGAKCTAMRLRPLLLQHLATVRTWRPRLPLRPVKNTPSKKGLLMDDKENSSLSMANVITNPYGIKVKTKPNLITANSQNHHAKEVDGDDSDGGRRIAAGSSSPSFRIFFEDAAEASLDDHQAVNLGQNVAAKETDSRCDAAPSKQENVQKRMRRERMKMKRHIKTVLSGKKREAGKAVKNLLNVKASCYHPSLLAAKKTSS